MAKTSTSSSYDDFLAELPPAECRYAIYDFEYEKGDEGKRNKICFFTWSPDDAKIKQKMVFASSKRRSQEALVGISSEIQGTDFSEVSHETVLEKGQPLHLLDATSHAAPPPSHPLPLVFVQQNVQCHPCFRASAQPPSLEHASRAFLFVCV